jgi:mRNA interferase RelE/StbE
VRTEFKKSFAKDLRARKNDGRFLDCVKEIIEDVECADILIDISNLKKLKGERDYYRVRFGNYRVGVRIQGDLVIFIRALHRKDIYRYFP